MKKQALSIMLQVTTLYRINKYTCALLLCLCVVSCGWQLRGYDELKQRGLSRNDQPAQIDLTFSQRNPGLLQTLHQLARAHRIEISQASPVMLTIVSKKTDRRHLAVTETGVAAQFQLTQTLTYSLLNKKTTQQAPPSLFTVTTRKNYDFDAAQIVAKNQEEKALLAEMRKELAQKILIHAKTFYLANNTESKQP